MRRATIARVRCDTALAPSLAAGGRIGHQGVGPVPDTTCVLNLCVRLFLIEQGLVSARPITYEDFLPVSAAGIFQSNLGGSHHGTYTGNANRDAFEVALGALVIDELELYAALETRSIKRIRERLSEKSKLEIGY